MAKILYGLCGVGIGHAVRGKVIINFLKKKHEVMVICSDRPYEYLKKYFKNVHKIEGFELGFKNNKIIRVLTILKNLKKVSKKNYGGVKCILSKIKKFNPDYVISDWESLSSFIAKELKVPLISIDNQHFLMKGSFEVPKRYILDYLIAKLIIYLLTRKADYYIISSFGETKLKKEGENIFLVPPVLREEVLNAKPNKKNYILVYQSTKTYKKLIKLLKNTDEKFIVYGYDKSGVQKNLIFKRFSEKEFLKYLIGCKAVICNGGFTLISEAIYLKKPLLTVPIKRHFEQLLNCNYVKDLRVGECYKDLNKKALESFLSRLNQYKFIKKKQNNDKLYFTLNKLVNSRRIRS